MRYSQLIAWASFVFSALGAIVGLGLMYHSGHTPTEPADLGLTPLDTVYALAFAGVGAIIASRRPRNPVGWLLCVEGLLTCFGAAGLGYGYAYDSLQGPDGPLPGAAWLAWFTVVGQSLGVFLGAVLFVLFPNGRPASSRWGIVMWAIVAAGVGNSLLVAIQPDALPGFAAIRNPAEISEGSPVGVFAAWFGGWSDAFTPIVLLVGTISLLSRFRSPVTQEREQIKWVVYALTLVPIYFAVLIIMTFATFPAVAGNTRDVMPPLVSWAWSAWPLVVTGIPLAIGVAILRYHLYEIDLIIRRTIVYGALSVLLALAYWLSVLVLQRALRPLTSGSDLAIVGSTLAVVGLFQPLRSGVQVFVDQRFYRRRYDAARTLEYFTSRLRDEVDLEDLGAELQAVVGQTLQPSIVSLWLRSPRKSSAVRNAAGTLDG
jgi:hypothetical protein